MANKNVTFGDIEKIAKSAVTEDKESVDQFCDRVQAAFRRVCDDIRTANKTDTVFGKLQMSEKYQTNDIPRVQTWSLWLNRFYAGFAVVKNSHVAKFYKVPISDDGSDIKFDLAKVAEVREDWIAKAEGFCIEFEPALWSPLLFGTTEKAVGPGGHVPDGTGPHGRGVGPGKGKRDGSGMAKEEDEDKGKGK